MKFILLVIVLTLCINFVPYGICESNEDRFIANLKKFKQNQNDPSVMDDFRKLANEGDKYSQYLLGTMALAQKIEMKEGIKWLNAADKNGCAGASGALGMLYLQGNGVEQDANLAKQFISKAAKNGDLSSQAAMASFYKNGFDGIQIDKIAAYAWISLAYDQCFYSKLKPVYSQVKNELESEFAGEELNSAIKAAKELKQQVGLRKYSYCSQSIPMAPDIR